MASVTSYPPYTGGGTVTSWLPITTAWPSFAACSTLVWEGYPPNQVIDDPGYGIYVDAGLKCLPPAATTWWEQDHTNYGATTLSLGPIICPRAYTTAFTSVQDASTFVACCPSDYSYVGSSADGQPGECESTVTVGQHVSIVLYKTITSANEVASAWVTSISTATNATVIVGIHMNGWNFNPSTVTSSPIPITSAPSTSTTPSVTTPPSSNPGNTSDNTGRNIGIGVGVSLGTIGVLAICFAIWYVRRRNSAPAGSIGPQAAAQAWGRTPDQMGQMAPMYEMPSSKFPAAHEMHAPYSTAGELYGNAPTHNMGTGY